jgi:aminopeptidase YwaD
MIEESLNNYMYDFIRRICEEIGPRESGTAEEGKAGDIIEGELKNYCDKTRQERYISSPHAFLGGIRYGAMLVLVSIVLYWLSLLNELTILTIPPIWDLSLLLMALILIITTVSYFILEVMKYHEAFDFLFPKKESRNIIGVIEPKDDATKEIIFSAHHDSAFEFNTFYYLKRFGQIIINIGYIGVVIVFLGIVLKLIFLVINLIFNVLFFVLGIVFTCFLPIIFVYIFFHSNKPVLGAFDNLSGVAVVLGIGRYLSTVKDDRTKFPQHTRVNLISFAGEESGLRGAKRYIKRHEKELKSKEFKIINMDSIAKKDVLIVHDKEPGIGAKHDPEIYSVLMDIAEKLNYNVKLAPLPFGATDAAAFSKKGIPATTIGGLNLKEELAPYYHTREDTCDVIEREALGRVVDLCLEYLKHLDAQE